MLFPVLFCSLALYGSVACQVWELEQVVRAHEVRLGLVCQQQPSNLKRHRHRGKTPVRQSFRAPGKVACVLGCVCGYYPFQSPTAMSRGNHWLQVRRNVTSCASDHTYQGHLFSAERMDDQTLVSSSAMATTLHVYFVSPFVALCWDRPAAAATRLKLRSLIAHPHTTP